ncbi:MAG: hypothetical protein ACXVBJ_00480 [Flavisolibacter sp.]
MKWALTELTNEVHYWKMYNHELPVEMKYNGRAQSFRLTAGDKRLFFVERTGFLQSKYLVRTEYSQVAGEAHPGKSIYSGVLVLDNKKFQYSFENKLLEVATKNVKFSVNIELDDINKIGAVELCALLFSSLKVMIKQCAEKPKLELA